MLEAGGYLRAEDRPLYEHLRAEWAAAVAAEPRHMDVVKAA